MLCAGTKSFNGLSRLANKSFEIKGDAQFFCVFTDFMISHNESGEIIHHERKLYDNVDNVLKECKIM